MVFTAKEDLMKTFMLGVLFAFILVGVVPLPVTAAPAPPKAEDYKILPKPGKKAPLDAGHHFIYGFEKQPKLGVAIMRLEIFTLDGKRDTSFVVTGDVDMPSMRGAHSTGGKAFKLSAKGIYLLPVPLVMPGDWEFRFVFEKKGKIVFRGAYLFDL